MRLAMRALLCVASIGIVRLWDWIVGQDQVDYFCVECIFGVEFLRDWQVRIDDKDDS